MKSKVCMVIFIGLSPKIRPIDFCLRSKLLRNRSRGMGFSYLNLRLCIDLSRSLPDYLPTLLLLLLQPLGAASGYG